MPVNQTNISSHEWSPHQSLDLLPGWSCPADHRLWRPVEEKQFWEEQFFKGQFSGLADKVDVAAQSVDTVDVWQFKEHDVLNASNGLQANDPTNDQDHRHVQANYATDHTHIRMENKSPSVATMAALSVALISVSLSLSQTTV